MSTKKICIHDCTINGLIFCRGCEYKVEFNHYDNQLYIYNVFGYTTVGKCVIDKYFF